MRLERAIQELHRPVWVDELLEAQHKQSRASVKQAARLESALAEQRTSITELAAKLDRNDRAAGLHARAQSYEPLFDALDALDEARRLCVQPELAAGLALIAERIVRFCEQAGFRRSDGLGGPPDARICRVVGAEPRPGWPNGHVSRSVQAAILHGERVLREGRAIVVSADFELTKERANEGVGH